MVRDVLECRDNGLIVSSPGECTMPKSAWEQLQAGARWFNREGAFPLPAYSEFMPPPHVGLSPYGATVPCPINRDDPWGWAIDEYEETFQLRPGLHSVASQLVSTLIRLTRGQPEHGISRMKLEGNPYWPKNLADRAGALERERYVVLLPLALSRTQDDKGRVRWTLFGGSEQGSSRAFWKSFYTSPGVELSETFAHHFVRQLIGAAYGVSPRELADLHSAGFRILPEAGTKPVVPEWREGPLPRWTRPFLWKPSQTVRGLRFLLTFRPFSELPESVQRAYLTGRLHLMPFPGSLLFWGVRGALQLSRELPLSVQVPLLNSVARHAGYPGIRVPQSGWLHEPRPDGPPLDERYGPIRGTFRRTHRNARVKRDAPHEQAVSPREDRMAHVLFSAAAEDMGLYDKPMARNAQIWSQDYKLILDGPTATRDDLERAAGVLERGGMFGYRFQYPAMRIGPYELYWHRPLVAFLDPTTDEPTVLPDGPLGYLTAYRAERPDPAHPVELWPRLLRRELPERAIELFHNHGDPRPVQMLTNVRKLYHAWALLGERPLPESFARNLLHAPRHPLFSEWLEGLAPKAESRSEANRLKEELLRMVAPPPSATGRSRKGDAPKALTYEYTARRTFELAFWRAIAWLSSGRFPNRNNADTARDAPTQRALTHRERDLDRLGDQLIEHYRRAIAEAGMQDRARVGDLPFHWRTDFDFTWSNGWLANQGPEPHERDLIVVIPGRNRRKAIIIADHYDTAYMGDRFEASEGGDGSRVAAPGADDNGSATATLMVAAAPLLELSRAGRLGCDVWLVHLTGEEFPSDCLGARHLARSLVEGTLTMRLPSGRRRDLSRVQVAGLYVLDMVAHNNPANLDVFQISPGTSRESLNLALHAHNANEAWNELAQRWNTRPTRRGAGRSHRSTDGAKPPATAAHPRLTGEIRLHFEPRCTLYNTDGQIFSDAGIPAVLFMEDYDIDRSGYHDTKDTIGNIDLDYGSAIAAIAIESVARAAEEAGTRRTSRR
jgi:hypothetical protein